MHFWHQQSEPIEIHGGCVRLYSGTGKVDHWDGSISAWRPGWGAYGTRSALGEDERKLEQWRRSTHAA